MKALWVHPSTIKRLEKYRTHKRDSKDSIINMILDDYEEDS
jgi:hypothetical protein